MRSQAEQLLLHDLAVVGGHGALDTPLCSAASHIQHLARRNFSLANSAKAGSIYPPKRWLAPCPCASHRAQGGDARWNFSVSLPRALGLAINERQLR